MGIDTRSVATQLSLGGLLQFQLNKASWRSACQMHAIVYFTLQMRDGGDKDAFLSHILTLDESPMLIWNEVSKCKSMLPKIIMQIFSCDTFVLELFHLKLQAIAHITINHRPPAHHHSQCCCNVVLSCFKTLQHLVTIITSRICCRTGTSLHCLTRITTGLPLQREKCEKLGRDYVGWRTCSGCILYGS
jgi:hypothetical protein